MAFWVIASTAVLVWQRLRATPTLSLMQRLQANSRAWWGMVIAHLGVAAFILGVTIVKGYESEIAVKMQVGDVAHLAGYDFTFNGVTETQGPNYTADTGLIRVTKNGIERTTLRTEKRLYTVTNMPMTEAGISPALIHDLYASLGEPLENGAWSVRIYHKPMVEWIWLGCLMMGAGGMLALLDKRYRIKRNSKSKPLNEAEV